MNREVDAYIEGSDRWPGEIAALRPILSDAGLTEAIKWRKPCYSHHGKNIVIVQEMKDFLALMFFKGALLSDPAGILREQGPNSRSARRIELTSVDEVSRLAQTISAYLHEAIAVEEAGIEVDPPPELVLVDELQQRLQLLLRRCGQKVPVGAGRLEARGVGAHDLRRVVLRIEVIGSVENPDANSIALQRFRPSIQRFLHKETQ